MPPHRWKRSKVWFHFKEQKDGNEALCNHCKMAYTSSGGNRSNRQKHLRTQHGIQFNECRVFYSYRTEAKVTISVDGNSGDLPHHYDCKEKEVQASQQPCNEETNCSLDQERPRQVMKEQEEPEFLQVNIKLEEPELLQLKEEQCETGISQVEERLVLNQQTDTLMMKEGDHGEPEPGEDQFPSQNAPEAENLNEKENLDKDSGLIEVLKQNNRDETKLRRKKVKKRAFCKICGKSFSPCYLYDHIRTHTGEKRFSFKTCGKRFIQSGQLTGHLRIHTGKKPFPCQMCGRRFNQKINLVTHMRIHSAGKNLPCEICGKHFSCNDLLASHLTTHMSAKPFSCQTCGKALSEDSFNTTHKNSYR